MNATHHALLALVVALALGVCCPVTARDKESQPQRKPADKKNDKKEEKNKEEASIWMTSKLKHSQDILGGLTRGNFETVRKHADAMLIVTYLERFDRADIPGYKKQLSLFEDANKELIRQAKNENLGGATLAYTQLMLTCVQCHAVVRDGKK